MPVTAPARRGVVSGWLGHGLIAGALLLLVIGARPASGQSRPQADTVWNDAVGRFLADDRGGAIDLLLRSQPSDLTRAADRAFEGWRIPADAAAADEARRTVIRRLQASALLPLEMLVGPSNRRLTTAHEDALLGVARDAWRRLGAFDDERGGEHAARVRDFRVWWRLGVLQHRVAAGDFADIAREADAARPPSDDVEATAVMFLLRGVALETKARLPLAPPVGTAGMTMRRLTTPSRLAPMDLAMDDAGKAYRRALELWPGDREARLRLARVAIERNRLDEAVALLGPMLDGTCLDSACGLAHLFSGEIHELRNQGSRASGAYARASSVSAVRPAALVAMMQASLRRGNAGGAYDLTRQFSTPAALGPATGPDAWSQYVAGELIETDRIVSHLRAGLVR